MCERTNEELLPLCDEVVEEDDKPDATAKVAEPPVEQAPATTTGTTTTSTTQQREPPADAPRHSSTSDHSPREKAASTSDAKKPIPKSEDSIKNSDPQQQQSATSTSSSTASSSADEQNTSKRKSAFAEEQDRPSPASAAAITGGDVSVRAGEGEDSVGTSTQHQATTRRPEKGVSPSSKNTAALLRAAGVSSDRTAAPSSSPVLRECVGAVNTFGSSSSAGATATAAAPSAAPRSGTTPSPTAKKKLRKPVPYYKRKIDLPTIASSKNDDYAVQECSGGDTSQDSDTPLTEEKIEEIVKQQRAFVNKMREDQRKEEEERKERKAAKAKARAAAASCGAGSSGASTKNKGAPAKRSIWRELLPASSPLLMLDGIIGVCACAVCYMSYQYCRHFPGLLAG